MCTSLAQERKFCSGGLVYTISAIGLLVRKHFCALSAAGQVGLKVGGPHPPVLKSKPLAMLGCIEMTCILTWLRYQGYTLLDLGETNMGITLDSVASPQPAVRFFDVLSWRKEQRTDGKWTGFHKLAAKVCPTHSRWLKTAVAHSGGDPNRVFRQVAAECQPWHGIWGNGKWLHVLGEGCLKGEVLPFCCRRPVISQSAGVCC